MQSSSTNIGKASNQVQLPQQQALQNTSYISETFEEEIQANNNNNNQSAWRQTNGWTTKLNLYKLRHGSNQTIKAH